MTGLAEPTGEDNCCCKFTINDVIWDAEIHIPAVGAEIFVGDPLRKEIVSQNTQSVIAAHERQHRYLTGMESFRWGMSNKDKSCCYNSKQTTETCNEKLSKIIDHLEAESKKIFKNTGKNWDNLQNTGDITEHNIEWVQDAAAEYHEKYNSEYSDWKCDLSDMLYKNELGDPDSDYPDGIAP